MRASLFVTCLVDQLFPDVGESAVRVLERLGVQVDFPPAQTCCGQPAFNAGFWRQARPLAERFLRVFRDAAYVVTPSGSCASMVRLHFRELLEAEPALAEQAENLASRTFELSEFLVDVLGVGDRVGLPVATARGPAMRVAYHESCHLARALGVVRQPRRLLESLPGLELVPLTRAEVCCGFGGVFAVKYPDISNAMLQDNLDNLRASGAEAVVAADMGCLAHIGGGLTRRGIPVRTLHLAQVLDAASAPA